MKNVSALSVNLISSIITYNFILSTYYFNVKYSLDILFKHRATSTIVTLIIRKLDVN